MEQPETFRAIKIDRSSADNPHASASLNGFCSDHLVGATITVVKVPIVVFSDPGATPPKPDDTYGMAV